MKSIITNDGLKVIGQNGAELTSKYWIGYFGLAYVPDELRKKGESDELKVDMRQLTISGDNIYNLFQGSMKPEGLNTDIGDSAAGKLYNECMYTSNVMSRFRYVMDKNEVNHLVVFESYTDPDTHEDGLRQYCDFKGVDQSSDATDSASESDVEGLPVPAPLFYMGEPTSYDAVEPPDEQVSCDTRTYSASDATKPGPGYASETWANDDNYGWAKTENNTYDAYHNVTNLEHGWQFQSVSNYNRFHAPANSAGYAVGYDPACRNIAKATRLFPIGHYDVLNTKNDEKVAKVQYTVDINLKSVFTEVSTRTNKYYDIDGNLVDPGTYKMSFKFNRVGIYAVPVALHAYTDEGENADNCSNYNVQMQITGNSEPLLFAVLDLDSPVIMSESGCLNYKLNFDVDYSVTDSAAVDSTSIFYNLYEDDAITWYKNQLIANASAANAITSLGVQMGYLRKQVNSIMPGSTTGCTITDSGSNYVYNNGGLKNLKDGSVNTGALRGVETIAESSTISVKSIYDPDVTIVPEQVNATGEYSMNLGRNSALKASRSIALTDEGYIGCGYRSDSYDSSEYALVIGGSRQGRDGRDGHIVVANIYNSIVNALNCEFDHLYNSMILCGRANSKMGITNTIMAGVNDNNNIPRYEENNSTGYEYWDNMLMLGDYSSPGKHSANSLVLGQYSATPIIDVNDTLVNSCQHSHTFIYDDKLTMHSLNQVIWWGDPENLLDLDDNASTEDYRNGWLNETSYVMTSALVFLGSYGNEYGSPDWLGIGPDMAQVGRDLLTQDGQQYKLMQPYKAPMIFTGGIALGGHGDDECDYGLLKLGTKLEHVSTNTELLACASSSAMVSVSTVNDSSDPITVTRISDGKYTVPSPHAGKVLTVLEDQELDGTLHIGLREPQGGSVKPVVQKQVTIHTSYVASLTCHRIEITTATMGGGVETHSYDLPRWRDMPSDHSEVYFTFNDEPSGIEICGSSFKTVNSTNTLGITLEWFAHPKTSTFYDFSNNDGWFNGAELYEYYDPTTGTGTTTTTVDFLLDGATDPDNVCYFSMIYNQAFSVCLDSVVLDDRGYNDTKINLCATNADVYTFDKSSSTDSRTIIKFVPVVIPDTISAGEPVSVGINGQGTHSKLTIGTYPYTWTLSDKWLV